jgi:RNA polymerase sigma factor (sigma-70 family)
MHQDAAVRLAATVSGGWGDPEAATQEALVKAYRALGRFRQGAPFRPWLFRIVVNEARNARRSGQRRRQLVEHLRHDLPQAPASPETVLLDADERRLLVAAVQRLPRRQREAVACRYFLELSEAETADVLGIAPGTVKSRLSRALRMLRAELAVGPRQRSEEVS